MKEENRMGVDGTAAYELAEGGRTEGGAVRRGKRSEVSPPDPPCTPHSETKEGRGVRATDFAPRGGLVNTHT